MNIDIKEDQQEISSSDTMEEDMDMENEEEIDINDERMQSDMEEYLTNRKKQKKRKKKKETDITDIEYNINIRDIIRRLIIAWIYSAGVMYVLIPKTSRALDDLESYEHINGWVGITSGILFFIILMSYQLWTGKYEELERYCMFTGVVLLSVVTLRSSFSVQMLSVLTLLTIGVGIYAFGSDKYLTRRRIFVLIRKYPEAFLVAAGLLFFGFLSSWLVSRVLTHSTPTYDFGIFAQMFYSMKTHGTMVTTLERAETLSHLNVHLSFIYYLMLPFYWIVSKPETLEVLQAMILASAIIPLWLLGKKHGLLKWQTLGICVCILLFPAYAGGTSYDLHENVFLTSLLFWLFYFTESRKRVGIVIFAALVMLVKEDAPVYTAIFGLYVLVSGMLKGREGKWQIKTGIFLFVFSVVYFMLAISYLASFGDGVMSGRYNNYMYDGSDSLLTVIKAVLLEPMKVVSECVDTEKLGFIGLTMGALCGIPLITKRYERYILLIPYLLINLMPDYAYQSSIFFQYMYGSTAFLFYLIVLNLSDLAGSESAECRKIGRYIILAPIMVSFVMFSCIIVPKGMTYIDRYNDKKDIYVARAEMLKKIPEGTAVAASTFFTTSLSNRDEIYDIKHAELQNILRCEYIVADIGETACYERFTTDETTGYEAFTELLKDNGFVLDPLTGNGLDVYVKKYAEK